MPWQLAQLPPFGLANFPPLSNVSRLAVSLERAADGKAPGAVLPCGRVSVERAGDIVLPPPSC